MACAQCGSSFRPAADLAEMFAGWTVTKCDSCAGSVPRKPPAESLDAVLARVGDPVKTGVFTGACCDPNPGPGAWSVVRVIDDGIVREATGWHPATTSNRMAMQSIMEALRSLDPGERASIYSNSETCVNTLKLWAPECRRNGWRRAPKLGPIANLDLVREALDVYERYPNASLTWLHSRSGSRWLSYAGSLAHWQVFDAVEGGQTLAAGSGSFNAA